MQILKYPNPLLSKISDPVKDFGEPLRKLLEDMFVTVYEQPPGTVAGLAAPQIGANLRVFIAQGKIFINPVITWTPKGVEHDLEGCFSSAEGSDKRFRVWRPYACRLKYLDMNKVVHEEKFTGYMARVIQHEMDHLNGVMCSDREKAAYGTLTTNP